MGEGNVSEVFDIGLFIKPNGFSGKKGLFLGKYDIQPNQLVERGGGRESATSFLDILYIEYKQYYTVQL